MDYDLSELAGLVTAVIEIEFRSKTDAKFKFMDSIYVDIGSRMEETDHYATILETTSGQLYDTTTSTALVEGKGFQDLTRVQKIDRLDYKAGHWTEKRYNMARLDKIMQIVDPTDRYKEFMKVYRDKINKYLVNPVITRRLGLIDTFFSNLHTLTSRGEKIIKSAADVAGTKYAFVNYIASPKGEAGLKAAYNAFGVQTDENGNPLGQQEIRWLFVNQDKAAAEELMHIKEYVHANYGNLTAATPGEKFAASWVDPSPDERAVYISDQHTILMIGREKIPVVRVWIDAEGVQFTVDEHAKMIVDSGVGLVESNSTVE